ncbi:MAG: hydroxymethylbilane synthase [Clostridiales bacterium]
MQIVRVGSRDSKLAIIQAEIVIEAIKRFDSSIKTELVTMKTSGDKILDKTLDKIGGKGLFVKELDEALLRGVVDITVHSYKDMPMKINKKLPIVALSCREDERDVLILPIGIRDETKPIGCSSKRRILQLKKMRYSNIEPIRGNVITRLKKLDDGEFSAIILAAAGITRLGLEDRISRYFTTEEIMPAACQGIIAVQSRENEKTDYLKKFHNNTSKIISDSERAFVMELNGGCSSPVAAYARIDGDKLVLNGLFVDEGRKIAVKGIQCGELYHAEKIGKNLANRLRREVLEII